MNNPTMQMAQVLLSMRGRLLKLNPKADVSACDEALAASRLSGVLEPQLYGYHYTSAAGASVFHFLGNHNEKKLEADLEAAKQYPTGHSCTPVFVWRVAESSPSRKTTYRERFADAVALMCGRRAPPSWIDAWLDKDAEDFRLQEFAISHGPPWAQGIVLLDAADILARTPAEGEDHEEPPSEEPSAETWTLEQRDAMLRHVLAIVAERIPAIKRHFDEWKGWPGTRAFAGVATVSAISAFDKFADFQQQETWTPALREAMRQHVVAVIDERISDTGLNTSAWQGWPGTWAFADAAVSAVLEWITLQQTQ